MLQAMLKSPSHCHSPVLQDECILNSSAPPCWVSGVFRLKLAHLALCMEQRHGGYIGGAIKMGPCTMQDAKQQWWLSQSEELSPLSGIKIQARTMGDPLCVGLTPGDASQQVASKGHD